ncbi:hypothetical protein BDN71DRAFT_1256540 [Pleurotus eryngii]|uniref:Uncharacterized protein n=1 Tax=Pleurotus eryngii TaxID=5323 RepID=A0A9P6A951_PLEER|nr:hypothetical protein BDN71DRAFT_1256540 [Pleurotus eryngii]
MPPRSTALRPHTHLMHALASFPLFSGIPNFASMCSGYHSIYVSFIHHHLPSFFFHFLHLIARPATLHQLSNYPTIHHISVESALSYISSRFIYYLSRTVRPPYSLTSRNFDKTRVVSHARYRIHIYHLHLHIYVYTYIRDDHCVA